ncbi:MAG: hypothetical protein CR217_05855 [Beijerinckiaceae bacterium]|nr:MAG: hypothetical protein CR217_05855 [Beijerinckiaceae bacterium]
MWSAPIPLAKYHAANSPCWQDNGEWRVTKWFFVRRREGVLQPWLFRHKKEHPMSRRAATISIFPLAFETVRPMQADGLDWREPRVS